MISSISQNTHFLNNISNNTTNQVDSSQQSNEYHILTNLHDINSESSDPFFTQLKNFISTHVSNTNNFKLVNLPQDKIFVIPNKLVIELKIYENLYLAFIHFTYSQETNFMSNALYSLNKLLSHELTHSFNERLLKLFDKKIILYSTINASFQHYYKKGPFPPNSKTIYDFQLPEYQNPWFEYTLKINQFIFNNLSKEMQKQKQDEKKALHELSSQSHHHKLHKKTYVHSNKKQKINSNMDEF